MIINIIVIIISLTSSISIHCVCPCPAFVTSLALPSHQRLYAVIPFLFVNEMRRAVLCILAGLLTGMTLHYTTHHSTTVWMKGVIYCFYSFVQFDYNWGLFTSHYQYLIVAFIHSLPFDLSNSIWTRCTRKHMWEFIIWIYKILDVSWMEFINILSKKNMPEHKHSLIVLIGESGEIKFRTNIFIFDLFFRWRGWARTIYDTSYIYHTIIMYGIGNIAYPNDLIWHIPKCLILGFGFW